MEQKSRAITQIHASIIKNPMTKPPVREGAMMSRLRGVDQHPLMLTLLTYEIKEKLMIYD
jgi:hypothetical protein